MALTGIRREKMDVVVEQGKTRLEDIRAALPGRRSDDFVIDQDKIAHVATLTLAECKKIIGGELSNPSKMSGYSFDLPAEECQTGGALRHVPGSVCAPGPDGEHGCYAYETGNFAWSNTVNAEYNKMVAIMSYVWGGNDLFPYALARLVTHYSAAITIDVFRWHSAGDLQSLDHLRTICLVAELTPHIRHWLPTREMPYLRAFFKAGYRYPSNLQVNFSVHQRNAPMINVAKYREMGIGFSFVVDDGDFERYTSVEGYAVWRCPSLQQGHKCLSCTHCWGSVPSAQGHKEAQPIAVFGWH